MSCTKNEADTTTTNKDNKRNTRQNEPAGRRAESANAASTKEQHACNAAPKRRDVNVETSGQVTSDASVNERNERQRKSTNVNETSQRQRKSTTTKNLAFGCIQKRG
jgi:hypothetical protein